MGDTAESTIDSACAEQVAPAAPSELDYYLGLSNVRIAWRMEEQELDFSVQHIDFPKQYASSMYRESELSYIAACGTTYTIPFFALNVRGDPSQFKGSYVQAIRILVAGRVRVTILTDKLAELKSKIRALKDLLNLCEDKLHFNLLRTEMYEDEMTRLSSDNPFKSSDRFSALLANTVGFAAVAKILTKESRRLSAPSPTEEEIAALAQNMDREPSWEELNNISVEESMEDLTYCWDFLQHWQILNAVCVRCRYGPRGYPVTTIVGSAPAKSVKGGLHRSIRPGWGERSFEEPAEPYAASRGALLTRSSSGINILIPIVAGNGVGPWEAVCDALECEENGTGSGLSESPKANFSLVLALHRVLCMIRSPFLVNVISRVAAGALAAAIEDMDKGVEQCTATADALLAVLADMGKHLESRLLLRLRTSPMWIAMLSDLRKSRVKREGGKLVVRETGDVEISMDGRLRTIPFADDYVDSDVLHGSIQRMKVHIAAPRCRTILKGASDRLVGLQGERSCSAQLMYSLALPLLQRCLRAAIVRHRYQGLRRGLVIDAMHAAAAIIQSWLIGCRTRAWYWVARAARRLWACTIIQRYARGFLARGRVNRMFESKLDNSKDLAATKLQALIRGVLARRRVAELIDAGKEETLKEAQNWGVLIIQKMARGYIARKTVIRSYHIRNSLSKPILKLTEKYLTSGNLWSFLSELDMTMRRITEQLRETEEREENWAETYVKKVVDRRKTEFDGAWNAFHEALTVSGGVNTSPIREGHGGSLESDPTLTAAGVVNGPLISPSKRRTTTTTRSTGNPIVGSSDSARISEQLFTSPGHIAVPGVLLRRAITSTVGEGMKQREQSVKASISLLAQQRDDIKDAYGTMVPIRAPVQMRKAKKRLGLTIQPNRGIEKNKGKIGACQSDWVTPAAGEVSTAALGALAVIIPSAGSQYTKQQRLEALREGNMSPRQQLLVPVALSDFLLLDIPLGLADKVDRLLFAAALRCFVPDFFPHHSLKEAYAMYRQMPNGLMKVRYEQCAYGWSQPIVSKLKMKGLGTITDLLPLSKCDMFLRSVATPLALLDAAKDIIVKLQNYSNFPKGLNHAETRDRTQAMMAGEFVSTLERPTSRSHKNLNRSDQIEVIACSSAFAGNQDAGIGLTFAESFLKEAIQRGSWTNMSAPVDELLLHAAFMICENVENVIATMVSVEAHNTVQSNQSSVYDSAAKALGDGYKGFKKIKVSEFDPDMVYSKNSTPGGSIETLDVFGNEKSISLHGHDSFIQFSRYLEYLSASNSTFDLSEMKQREAIRERYRTALLLSTPFELNLKSQGVNTVAQLARYDLSSLDLPSLYRTQIESMLSTAIAASVGVKEANKISTGSHLPPVNNQIAFKVPLVYDSKFQRGPFDPYGIPPRLNLSTSLSEASISEKKNSVRCVRKKQKKVGTSRSDIDAPIGLPLGLWSTKVAIDKDCKHDSTEILLYEESRAIEFSTKQSDLSKGRSVSNFLKTLPGPREARRVRDQKEFNGTFERPYKCTHKGCNEAFSRPYTLRMHEKSHLIEFRDYTNYRNNPQYCLDANTDVQRRENETRFNNAAMLPQFIQNQLNTLCR